MSSRLMPPTVGSSILQKSMISFGVGALMSRSNTSTSANALKSTPLPSITGFPASGPMLPSPRTAVPFDTTATRLPRAVYLYARSGSFSMSRHGSATPGV